jgi:hypothetical protein
MVVAGDTWLEAELKMVTDGSHQTPYLSGFHVYQTEEDVRNWFNMGKDVAPVTGEDRVIVRVLVGDTRLKPKAVRKTLLTHRIKITSKNWQNRKLAHEV